MGGDLTEELNRDIEREQSNVLATVLRRRTEQVRRSQPTATELVEMLRKAAKSTWGEPASPVKEKFKTLHEVESAHINKALALTNGNMTQAARILGIHLRTLQRKLARKAKKIR